MCFIHIPYDDSIVCFLVGIYERSCFGTSLETLASIKEPIREVSFGTIIEKVCMD